MSVHYAHKGTNSKTLTILFLFNQKYLLEKLCNKCIACNTVINQVFSVWCLHGGVHVFWIEKSNHSYWIFCMSTPSTNQHSLFICFSGIYLPHEHYNQSTYLLDHLQKENTKRSWIQSKHIFLHLQKCSLCTQLSIYKKKKKKVFFYYVNFPFFISHLRSQIIIAYNWKASSYCLTPSVIIHPCAKNINVAQQSSIYTSFAEHKLYSPGYCTLGFPSHNLKLNIINKITDSTTLPFQTTFACCRCYCVL